MSFINTNDNGKVYAPGWFLAGEECTRETRQIAQSGATTAADGSKYVKMGTPYPSNDANAIGFVYEDVDVTTGDMPGSVVTKGVIYKDRLPVTLNSNAANALTALGFKIITAAPTVERPTWAGGELTTLTVNSAAGTAVGDTAVTVSGASVPTGGGYVYKVADTESSLDPHGPRGMAMMILLPQQASISLLRSLMRMALWSPLAARS